MTALALPVMPNSRWCTLVALIYGVRLTTAFLIALPVAAALVSPGLARHPTGDAILFVPGSTFLIETLRLAGPALQACSGPVAALWLLGLASALLPLGMLLNSFLQPTRPVHQTIPHAIAAFPRFLLLGGVGLLAQLATISIALVPIHWAFAAYARSAPAAAGLVLLATLGLLALSLLCLQGIVVDLARTAHVARAGSAFACVGLGVRVLWQNPWALSTGFAVRALSVVALGIAVGFAVGAVRVEQGDAWRWISALLLHQLVVLFACTAEASWQRKAIALTIAAPELAARLPPPGPLTASAVGDTASENGAPRDPS